MDLESAIDSSSEFQSALRQVFAAKNSLCRADRYMLQQAVLRILCRLPGSLLLDTNAAPHVWVESDSPEGERFSN